MGSAALAAAVALPRSGDPNFPQGMDGVLKLNLKKIKKLFHIIKSFCMCSIFCSNCKEEIKKKSLITFSRINATCMQAV